jgi:hypothetical protein
MKRRSSTCAATPQSQATETQSPRERYFHRCVSELLWFAALIVVSTMAPARPAFAQGLAGIIENYYPEQLAPGQTTTLNVAIPNGRQNMLTGLEITPSTGVTVGMLKPSEAREGVVWYQIPITVAKDAPAGKRTLAAVGSGGKTLPVDITIPDHTLTISNLKATSAPANGKTVEFQFSAVEQGSGTLGAAPMAWFMLNCGKTPEVGVVTAKVANGLVTATIPHPKTITGPAAPTYAPKCELQVHATDAAGVESNTTTAPLEFK